MPASTSTVVAPPTFTWPSVPMANYYVVEVRDVLGEAITWGGFDARNNPRSPILAPNTSVQFTGTPALSPGVLYSWRIYAAKDVTTGAQFELIAASEQLGGEFRVAH